MDYFGDSLPDELKHINPKFLIGIFGFLTNASTQIRQRIFKQSADDIQQEIAELRVKKRYIT